MFKTISPEQAGISSKYIYNFIKTLDDYGLNTHSILMARGNDIFAEAYYAPFDAKFNHRMYSVSKSFTSMAVGCAIDDGYFKLDDKISKYFPEYRTFDDPLQDEATILDQLTMRSSRQQISTYWGKPDRAEEYFERTANKIPGTNYFYDSAGSFILGCLVEKLTGKTMLDYMKDKFLREIGFSEESDLLRAPGDKPHCDSGILCTTRDLFTLGRFVANGGTWNGKRYISEQYMRDAVTKQTDNNEKNRFSVYNNCGYGYLIWMLPREGFGFTGMADQLLIYDKATDFMFVITSENMGVPDATRTLIYHELYKSIIDNIGEPLPEDSESLKQLREYEASRTMICPKGEVTSTWAERINGRTYKVNENPMGITSVKFELDGDTGVFEYENADGINRLKFGMAHYEYGKFPGKRRMSITASVYEDGQYDCGASAVWCEDSKLQLTARIIDTYLGTMTATFGFKDDRVMITMHRNAQRILDEYEGVAIGTMI